MDAVSDRDFVAETLFDVALLGVHLSRMGEELVLWTIGRVQLRHVGRRVHDRLVDAAPEEEQRRRRTRAGEERSSRRQSHRVSS